MAKIARPALEGTFKPPKSGLINHLQEMVLQSLPLFCIHLSVSLSVVSHSQFFCTILSNCRREWIWVMLYSTILISAIPTLAVTPTFWMLRDPHNPCLKVHPARNLDALPDPSISHANANSLTTSCAECVPVHIHFDFPPAVVDTVANFPFVSIS